MTKNFFFLLALLMLASQTVSAQSPETKMEIISPNSAIVQVSFQLAQEEMQITLGLVDYQTGVLRKAVAKCESSRGADFVQAQTDLRRVVARTEIYVTAFNKTRDKLQQIFESLSYQATLAGQNKLPEYVYEKHYNTTFPSDTEGLYVKAKSLLNERIQ